MPNKYFIYASGRWCEVDLQRGRVEGFRQRARFAYLRGGRLEVGRTATILRALRALAAGDGGAAQDFAPLLHRRPHKSRRASPRAHRCCSQHRHHSRCDVNANELGDKPTPAAVHAQVTSPRKRKRSSSEESHSKAKQIKSDKVTQKSKKAIEDKEELIVKSLLEDSKEKKSPQKKTVKVRGPEEEKLVQSLLQSSSSEDIKEQIQSPILPGPKSRKGKETQRSPKKLHKAKTVVRGKEEEKLVQSLLQSSSDDEQVPNKSSKPSPKSQPTPESDSSSSSSERKEVCKELVIDDDDVRVMRRFLARTAEADEIKRFDKDEEYKTRVFYKLNPLVCLKRYGPLEKLLTQQLTLKEFAKHLGLRSVADVTPEKRYRMRHSTRQARNTASITSDSEKEKLNAVQPKRRQLWNRNRELFNNSQLSQSSELKVKPQIHRPARNSSRDTTDSDTEVKQHIRRHLERRASVKLNPERKETGTNKDDSSIVVESDSDESSKSGNQRKTRRKSKGTAEDNEPVSTDSLSLTSVTDGNERKTRRNSKTTKEHNESVLVSDDNSINADGNERKTRRKSKETKKDNESVLVNNESDRVVVQKQRKSRSRTRAKRKSANDKSVVSSDESEQRDSNTSTNESAGLFTRRTRSQGQEKLRRKSKETKKDNESVLVSNDNSINADGNERKTRRKSKETKKDNESVLVSDESDRVVVQKQRKSKSRTRAKRKSANDKSVVSSDESEKRDSNTSDSTNESAGRSTRRTRSQGQEKRLLREHINNSDSNAQKYRRSSRTKSEETVIRHGKSILVSDSNTDENQIKNVRTRSKDLNKDLKDIKASDRKTKKDVDSSTETKKTTRSSMKITEDNSKENDKGKVKNSKKDEKSSKIENTSNKRKEEKPGPSRRELKENPKKPETDNDQDKSEISDSSDAFETSKLSLKKNKEEIKVSKHLAKRKSAMNVPRNHKRKFIKQKPENSDNKNKINEKEKAQIANDDRIEKSLQKDKNKGNDKDGKDNEADKEKNKVLKDIIDRDKDEKERSKGSDSKMTENKGKENSRKAAAARSMFVKPVKFKKSSVANGREYTSSEDHAIVAWISLGNRMRMVNGNTVWRELQSEYTRLTSQTRSWHSLRNRYLRYILPSLGELALPPSQVSRLRAAAAVGKIKRVSRRNSIFKTQRVVSASTVGRIRFRPASDSDLDSDKNKAPTPPPAPRRRPAPSPPKPSPASPPRARRLRARSSNVSASPTLKKRRIHHL
ncbi:uncharacterized protein DDB_G0284459-like [Cydia strobilella]|uniref:uncharacterized protein DDB_G0284459-like n=1 Tax=Cydia strobilella TaxID=1100964 RepID=UPI0030055D45